MCHIIVVEFVIVIFVYLWAYHAFFTLILCPVDISLLTFLYLFCLTDMLGYVCEI